MNNKIENELYLIIEKKMRYSEKIERNTNLIEDLGFTSIDLMELIYQLEDYFDIQFTFDDLDIEKIMIIGNLIDLISSKVNGGK